MGIYRELSNSKGVFRLLGAQLLARFPAGMLSLVLLLHMEHIFHNYTSGGIMLATLCIGQAAAGPVTTRWMGKWGMRPVLTTTTIICVICLLLVAYAPFNLLGYTVIAVLLGFTIPPIAPAVRTIFPKLVPGKLLNGLYSLDASVQEIIWAIGPVIAVFVAISFSPSIALTVAAALMVLGGIWFISSPELGQVKLPPARRKIGAVFTRRSVGLAVALGFLYLIAFAAFEAGVVSIFGHESFDGGFILGINAFGSFVGGMLVGHRALNRWALPTRMLVVFVGFLLCLISLETWWLTAIAFIGGLGAAPTFAGLSSLISSTVKFSETAEAFGWSNTGQLIGAAIGSALAGISIDAIGARGAFVVAGVAMGCAILTALIWRNIVPDLRGKDASPIPDTEQIPVTPQVGIG